MREQEYLDQDGLGLARLVAQGDVTAAELLASARARADAVDRHVHALCTRLDDHADQRVTQELTGPFASMAGARRTPRGAAGPRARRCRPRT